LAGKKGMDLEFLGKYQVTDSQFSALLVNGGEKLTSGLKKVRNKVKKLSNSSNSK
jgi:hypothetical protein